MKFPIESNKRFEDSTGLNSEDLGGGKFKASIAAKITPKKWGQLQTPAGAVEAIQMSRSVVYAGSGWTSSATEEHYLSDAPCFVRKWTYRDNYNNKSSVELVSESLVRPSATASTSTADEAAAAAEAAARAAEEAARVAAEKAAAAKAAAEKAAAEKAAAEAAKKVSIVFSFQDGSGATVDHQVDGSSLSPPITSCELGLTVKDVVRIYDTLPMRYADFKVLDMRCVGN